MLQPRHQPDSLGELNYCHIVAVVNIFQQLVDLLFQLSNPGLHCKNIKEWLMIMQFYRLHCPVVFKVVKISSTVTNHDL